MKDLKDFVVVNGELYHLGNSGALARAVSLIEAREELCRIHVDKRISSFIACL